MFVTLSFCKMSKAFDNPPLIFDNSALETRIMPSPSSADDNSGKTTQDIPLLCPNGTAAKALRRSMKMNQYDFWSHVGVTQSGGSRYESGRDMPVQVTWALHIAYGTEDEAADLARWLRREID